MRGPIVAGRWRASRLRGIGAAWRTTAVLSLLTAVAACLPAHAATAPEPAPDVIVETDATGRPILPDLARARGRLAVAANELRFTFESPDEPWTPGELEALQHLVEDYYPTAVAIYGPPAFDITVNVRKGSVPPRYRPSRNEITLYGVVTDVFVHEMLHAFHDDAVMFVSVYEEGLTRGAEISVLDARGWGSGHVQSFNPHWVYGRDYDMLNRPAASAPGGITRLNPRQDVRYLLGGYAWAKSYLEDAGFFARFNARYYAEVARDPNVRSTPRDILAVLGAVTASVEGEPVASWVARQHILNAGPAALRTSLYQDSPQDFENGIANRGVDLFRSEGPFESGLANEVIEQQVLDYAGATLDRRSAVTNASGRVDFGSVFTPPGYVGRAMVIVTSSTSDGAFVTDTTYRSVGRLAGLFGVVRDALDGEVTVRRVGSGESLTTHLTNGSFDFPSLRDVAGTFEVTFTYPDGRTHTRIVTKDASDYYVLLGLTGEPISLEPTADTYVEARTEATWDHGASDHLDVDLSPFGITYLRFDLRDIAGPVARATLTLHCTNASNDGGTLYPVRDSSWLEGDRTGVDSASANGPGLKWTEVDTNRDGAITAADATPYVPDFTAPIARLGAVRSGQTLTVDVTAAFGAGPGLYTLAIKSDSTDGATYSSRQHPTIAWRPRLEVSVCGDGVLEPGEECDPGPDVPDDCCLASCILAPAETACSAGACLVGVCGAGGTCVGATPRPAVCGDGHVCGSEACDPPGSRSGCAVGSVCSYQCTGCVPAVCGNGIVEPGEECDAGPDVAGSCCTYRCTFAPEDSWCSPGELGCVIHLCDGRGACVEHPRAFECGDGFTCGGEVCEPVDHRGCPAGSTCDDTCTSCVFSECGNGVLEYPEQCDDGNRRNGDACDSGCRIGGPVADTYIETEDEQKREHGGCTHLDVERRPATMAYLAFDVPGDWYPLMRAILRLHVLDSSDDGGTIYPASCEWAEGSRCRAGGSGLRWVDVDCNRDGRIDDRDLSCGGCVPDFSNPVAQLGPVKAGKDIAVDVTPLFPSGGGTHVTLVLESNSTNRAIYASRQHPTIAWRPRLEVIDLANDDCDTPTVIITTPFRDAIDTRRAGVPDGDPSPTCGDQGSSVWYEFTAPADGTVTVSTLGSDYDTNIAAYVGTTCNARRNDLTEVGCNNDAGGGLQSELSFRVTGGVRYLIAVNGASFEGGMLDLRLDFAPDCGDGVVGPGEQCDDGNTLDGDACDSACRISGPVADTYIEARTEATWDHGASDHLDVDLSPFGITYLRFDLRSLVGPVARATLTLHCTNTSNDGGTLYPVRDSSWVEGDRTGVDSASANGPGLTWTEVDTNRDGAITAADPSPFVPDLTAPIATLGAVRSEETLTADVTAAFGAGPGLYTLAIKSNSTDGATYSSRQHPAAAQRPRLRVEVGR